MSFAEVLAEIPRLTPEQRRELLRRVLDAQATIPSPASAAGFQAHRQNGRLVLSAPRTIQQVEVDAILADFP